MKKMLIIGGSKGIGRAILNHSLSEMEVISISRTPIAITHPNLTEYNLDILSGDLPEIDTLDYLVYCPGSITLKPINRLQIEDFKTDLEINVIGAIKAIQKYIPALKKGTNPSVLLFSTVASKIGMPFHSSIAVSKSAIEGLVKSLAAEFATVIRFNAIAPTLTQTELASKILKNEAAHEAMTLRHPLKKILHPQEIATLASYILSDHSLSMSGQIFQMDCGLTTLKI